MRIPSFKLENQRGIQLARCDAVPMLMVIAGPNGAGKSTLLYGLRDVGGHERILYVGPHRAIRRQHVRQFHLISNTFDLEKLLAQDSVPGFDGIRLFSGTRDPWDADDSANYLKHSLCQIEIERQQAIAARFDLEREIRPGTIPDPWKPLRDLANNLLPHLAFSKIDNLNRDNIRCLWKVHSKDKEVDFDELSSGEKSVIQMFYPLVENEIRSILEEIRSTKKGPERQEMCVLIDEPELHLHPNLQVKVFDYLRFLTSSSKMQTILATHSPTIVEHATADELFLLRPTELVKPGENQLVQVASNEERMKFLRDVFGTTSNLTAMQPVVIVEGISEYDANTATADRKLYRALHKGFDRVTLLPSGGKSECLSLLQRLNEALSTFSERLDAYALLDSDLNQSANYGAKVHLLPVSMIENFMVDPVIIWEAIQSIVEKTSFKNVEELTAALDALLDSMEPVETDRRGKAILSTAFFRPKSPLGDVPAQATAFSSEVVQRYSQSAVTAVIETATAEVSRLKAERKRRERFDGKAILDEFYKQYLQRTGLAKGIFKYECARHARQREAVQTFFDNLFTKLKRSDPFEAPPTTIVAVQVSEG